jgi:hypothetical protein
MAQATGFLDGAIVHLLGLIRHGLMPYPGIPRPFKAYFTAVVILDAATMALLLARSRWSVPLGLATDLTANLIAQYRYWGGDAAAPGLLPLYGFGLLVFSSPAPCGGCCPVGPARQRGQTSRNFCPAAQAATTRAAPPSLREPALVLPGSRCGRIDLSAALRQCGTGTARRAAARRLTGLAQVRGPFQHSAAVSLVRVVPQSGRHAAAVLAVRFPWNARPDGSGGPACLPA